jgi:hypothetical protein
MRKGKKVLTTKERAQPKAHGKREKDETKQREAQSLVSGFALRMFLAPALTLRLFSSNPMHQAFF